MTSQETGDPLVGHILDVARPAAAQHRHERRQHVSGRAPKLGPVDLHLLAGGGLETYQRVLCWTRTQLANQAQHLPIRSPIATLADLAGQNRRRNPLTASVSYPLPQIRFKRPEFRPHRAALRIARQLGVLEMPAHRVHRTAHFRGNCPQTLALTAQDLDLHKFLVAKHRRPQKDGTFQRVVSDFNVRRVSIYKVR
jgi:hypothetical protein